PCNKAATPFGKQTAHHSHLYVVPLNGSAWTELLDADNGYLTAAWSPDGSSLPVETSIFGKGSFMPRCDPAEAQDTFDLVALGTGSDRSLGKAPVMAGGLQWSPDGTRLAFSALDGTYVMDPTSGAQTKIAEGQSGGVDWSPDGTWMITALQPADPFGTAPDVWIVGADGTGLQRVLNGYAGAIW